jgi:type IX secretion system PorP/SprF family membrane protein
MAKKLIFSLIILLAAGSVSNAQDPLFSQFYANPLYLNPAMAGNTYCGRLNLNFRNQWPSISGGYITYNVSYDQFIEKINSGYGVMFTGDRQGDGAMSTMMISGLYSYKLMVSESTRIDFGIQASYNQTKIDWDKFVFGDMIDPNSGSTGNPTMENPADWNKSVSYVDFSAGVLVGYEDKYYGGIAVYHMNEPDNGLQFNSQSKLPMKITVHGGMEYNATHGGMGGVEKEDVGISANFIYQRQDKFQQLNLGVYATLYPFVTGLWFRYNFENPDAVIALIGFKQDHYRLGYSYDFTVSKIGLSGGGAHEISFAWEFCIYKEDYKRRVLKAIKSPSF